MTILVLGRSGQLAAALRHAGGDRVVAVGRPAFDLTRRDAAERLLERAQPAAVINAAAYTAVDRAETDPDAAFALNRDGPARLAAACARHAIPLVHVSTDAVFDGTGTGAYVETDAPNPLSTYGLSKLAGERAVREALPGALVVRISWLFGPHGASFVTRMLDAARERPALTLPGDQRGRPTHAPSLAGVLLSLAGAMARADAAAPSGLLHLAGASVLTRAEQALLIFAASAARGGPTARVSAVETRQQPRAARRPLNAELDCSRAAALGLRLGPFVPDLETTLDRLVGPRRDAPGRATGTETRA